MSSAAPAIPLFGDAYMADTRHLSLEEHGAYLNLMMIAWRSDDCSLPDDDARLARMLGVTAKKWAKLKPTIMGFWTLEDGRWGQKRLTKERRFVAKKSKQNAEAANARWNAKPLETNGTPGANASPPQSERNAPPPSPTQVSKEDTPSGVLRARVWPCPPNVDPDHWRDLKANRKTKRLTNTDTAYRNLLADLDRLSDDDWPPGRLVEHAAAKGWAAIHDPRKPLNGHTNGQSQPSGIGRTEAGAIAALASIHPDARRTSDGYG